MPAFRGLRSHWDAGKTDGKHTHDFMMTVTDDRGDENQSGYWDSEQRRRQAGRPRTASLGNMCRAPNLTLQGKKGVGCMVLRNGPTGGKEKCKDPRREGDTDRASVAVALGLKAGRRRGCQTREGHRKNTASSRAREAAGGAPGEVCYDLSPTEVPLGAV